MNICAYVCAGMQHPYVVMYRPEAHIMLLYCSLPILLRQDLSEPGVCCCLAGLPIQQSLTIPSLALSPGITGICSHNSFYWVLGIRTQVLRLTQQTLYCSAISLARQSHFCSYQYCGTDLSMFSTVIG